MSFCCDAPLANEMGHNVCTMCGKVQSVCLDTTNTSYAHVTRHYIVKPYTRKSRFVKKCLSLLRCIPTCKIDEKLLFFLKTRKIETPEDLHQEIGLYPTKGRRPYEFIMY